MYDIVGGDARILGPAWNLPDGSPTVEQETSSIRPPFEMVLFFVCFMDVWDSFFWVGPDSFPIPEDHAILPHGWDSLPIHLGMRSWWCALVPCGTSLFPHSPQSFRLWRPTCSCNGPPLCSASVTSRLCSSVLRRLPSTHHRLDPTLETHRYPTLSSVFFLSISSSLVGWDRPDRPSSATSVPLRPLSSIPPLPFGGPKDGARRGPQGGLAVAVLPDTRERVGGTAVCDGVRVCGTFGASGRTKSSALRVHDRRAVVSEVWKATR